MLYLKNNKILKSSDGKLCNSCCSDPCLCPCFSIQTWDSSKVYYKNEIVYYEGSWYRSIFLAIYAGDIYNNKNKQPDISPEYWEEGIENYQLHNYVSPYGNGKCPSNYLFRWKGITWTNYSYGYHVSFDLVFELPQILTSCLYKKMAIYLGQYDYGDAGYLKDLHTWADVYLNLKFSWSDPLFGSLTPNYVYNYKAIVYIKRSGNPTYPSSPDFTNAWQLIPSLNDDKICVVSTMNSIGQSLIVPSSDPAYDSEFTWTPSKYYSPDTPYAEGALVIYSDDQKIYTSLADNNLEHRPDISPAWWKVTDL